MSTESRYDIAGNNPKHEISVGWDAPLTTFFAQVFDSDSEDDMDEPVLWLGDEPMQIPTLELLIQRLAPFASIPPDILEKLQKDYDQPWSPSPLQQLNRKLYEKY
jgi:hypothetical protein